jgi:hypothetical protein
MNLGQNIQIFVLVHRSLTCFVEQNVILLSELLYLTLKHAVVVYQSVICIFGLADCHLKFFLYLFLKMTKLCTFEDICSRILAS